MTAARVTNQLVEALYTRSATPNARVTQQGIEALYTRSATPSARITGQVIEVLYTLAPTPVNITNVSILEVNAVDNVSATQIISGNPEYIADIGYLDAVNAQQQAISYTDLSLVDVDALSSFAAVINYPVVEINADVSAIQTFDWLGCSNFSIVFRKNKTIALEFVKNAMIMEILTPGIALEIDSKQLVAEQADHDIYLEYPET